MTVRHPVAEGERLEALYAQGILDTPEDEGFNHFVVVAAQLCNCPIALISLVDRDRQWFKAKVGVSICETTRDVSFCTHAVAQGETLVVEDALRDERFRSNPLVLSAPHIRFYAGVPIRAKTGHPLGTLCVIDSAPRSLSAGQHEALSALALELEEQLELRRTLRELERTSTARRELATMLVHDLRSPLTVILGAVHFVLGEAGLAPVARDACEDVLGAAHRIMRMTRNILDLQRDEIGSLTAVNASTDMNELCDQLIRGARRSASYGGQDFSADITVDRSPVSIDGDLLRRTLENLLDNAFKYAPRESTVRLVVHVPVSGALFASVHDSGPGIPANVQEAIFSRGYRVDLGANLGHGLGLYFCRLAVQAMGGQLRLESSEPGSTRFALEIPLPD